MKLLPDIGEMTGLYLGTEIDEKWWKRYAEGKFLARGNGKYWNDERAFYFLRHLTKEPITIPFENMEEFKTGKWHSGRWCFGYPVLKIIWHTESHKLSSGFLISRNYQDTMDLISELNKHLH